MWKGRICINVRCSVLVMFTFKLIGVRTTGTLLHYSETTWTVFGTHMSKASNIKQVPVFLNVATIIYANTPATNTDKNVYTV